MKRIFIFLLATLVTSVLFAQTTIVNRLELNLKDDYKNRRVTEFGKFGFILREKDKKSKSTDSFKFSLYNTDLERVKSKNITLDYRSKSVISFYSDSTLQSFFTHKRGNYSIISVNASDLTIKKRSGKIKKFAIQPEHLGSVTYMTCTNKYMYICGNIKKEPSIIRIDLKTGKKKIIPVKLENYKRKKIKFEGIEASGDQGEVLVYINAFNKRKDAELYIIRINPDGTNEEAFNLTKSLDRNLTDISCNKLNESSYIFTGTYSQRNSLVSQGLYFIKLVDNEIQAIKYHNFIDLDNFTDYLKGWQQTYLEKRNKKKKEKGKELKSNYLIASHPMITTDDGYLYLGEAFYPTYHTETRTSTDANGKTTTTRTTVFDGYQYTHAILCKFNEQGDIIWDQILSMFTNETPKHVKHFISIAENKQNAIKLIYSDRSNLVSKSFDFDGNIIKEYQAEKISTINPSDNAKRTYSNIEYWYDNYFLIYGSQKVKNKENGKKRKVYFVNKVKY